MYMCVRIYVRRYTHVNNNMMLSKLSDFDHTCVPHMFPGMLVFVFLRIVSAFWDTHACLCACFKKKGIRMPV